jgi:acyl transferase domain-containing protein
VVCGANLPRTSGITTESHGARSSPEESACNAFDANADGYACAEAVNAIYIKRLDDAIRDRNPIRAIVRSSATNFDDKATSISNPSIAAQDSLIQKAYLLAGLDTAQTAFCECHGTGTPVGDATEAQAIANIWQKSGGILIGSVRHFCSMF